MKLNKILFLTMISLMLSSCAAIDPTRNDLKSPCVANEDSSGQNPCVRRQPSENARFII